MIVLMLNNNDNKHKHNNNTTNQLDFCGVEGGLRQTEHVCRLYVDTVEGISCATLEQYVFMNNQ